MTDDQLKKVLDELRIRGEYVTCAESCTGGMLSGRITDIPGSSDVFRRGYVTYCDEAKHEMLGVSEQTLACYTAVSPQTAEEMAVGAAQAAQAQAALSVTGYAGPGGDEDGLVYIGCYYRGKTRVDECHFAGSRVQIRLSARDHALQMLEEVLAVGTPSVSV